MPHRSWKQAQEKKSHNADDDTNNQRQLRCCLHKGPQKQVHENEKKQTIGGTNNNNRKTIYNTKSTQTHKCVFSRRAQTNYQNQNALLPGAMLGTACATTFHAVLGNNTCKAITCAENNSAAIHVRE